MIVLAVALHDDGSEGNSQWTVLEDDNMKQIEWECGRQVLSFLIFARSKSSDSKLTLEVCATHDPNSPILRYKRSDGNTRTTP